MKVLAVGMEGELARAVRSALEPVVDGLWWADGAPEALAILEREEVALVVAPLHVGGRPATRLVDGSDVPLVVVGAKDSDVATAMDEGALDGVPDASVLRHVARSVARERAERERAQVAEERLLHANRLIGVGRLAAVTAHEVGTPLNVARMQAQLIAADAPDDQGIAASCATIVEQIDVVSGRLRAMLDFARLGERGRGPINFAEAVHSAASLLKPVAVRQGVELVVVGPDLMVVANRSQVQQVVFNLLSNALHALDGAGRIDVVIGRREREGRGFGTVSVSDDGPGVPDSVREHLFDAFVTTKPAGRGTGLGLSVCRDIADAHGGWIDVVSDDEGTRVEVAFPT